MAARPTLPPLAGSAVDRHHSRPLHDGWQLTATAAGACSQPDQLAGLDCVWRAAVVPGTVAMATDTTHCDNQDWWYRCHFSVTDPAAFNRLRFDGLATLAEVWLNNEHLLSTDNMFVPHLAEFGGRLRADNELVIRFRSLTAELAARRPRPRWKSALINHQQLRWFRTTLLGRIPGWTPTTPAVGPWQDIHLEGVVDFDVAAMDLQTRAEGGAGIAQLAATLRHGDDYRIDAAHLCIGDRRYPLTLTTAAGSTQLAADLRIPDVPLWWPHTHGTPQLLDCRIDIDDRKGRATINCGRVGFKAIGLDRSAGAVQIIINGVPVFCRGACWTISDFNALLGTAAQRREALELARDAGANMLRIGGTMIYEADDFYALCDELGILVWQDFMFANMDYPVADAAFRATVEHETEVQLQRLQKHPCIAVYCGGSEIEQQAAMLGLPASEWSNDFFSGTLPERCAQRHAGIPYFPSSPCEGALPFHVAEGIAHYYGVGAYRRPLTDVKHAGVKFSSESLGFSNVPDPETMELLLDGALPLPHHPLWKSRVPRDSGSGYDFEDIRDHYLKEVFGLDPVMLRSQDAARYYAMSRAVSGEVMKTVFAEWRKPGSLCGGALVWFYKDLWPGAGWGIVDSTNRPKAAYWYLKRAWAARTVLITDQGLDGLQLHVVNETPAALNAVVELELWQHGRIRIADAAVPVQIAARSATTLLGDAMLPYFYDMAYAYRFGPPKHDVVVARLRCSDSGAVLGEDFLFPQGANLPLQHAAQIDAQTTVAANGTVLLTLSSTAFLQSVAVSANGYRPTDNYFHLAPGHSREISFTPMATPAKKFKAYLSPLNLPETFSVKAD